MDGAWLGPVTMIAGASLFGLTAIFAIKAVARLALAAPKLEREVAELKGQVAALNVQVAQAIDDAEAARRIASRRKRKADRAAVDEPETPAPVPSSVPRWVPGATGSGEPWVGRPEAGAGNSKGEPVELVD